MLIESLIFELIINSQSYEEFSINARTLVKNFTWDSYIDKVLLEIKKL